MGFGKIHVILPLSWLHPPATNIGQPSKRFQSNTLILLVYLHILQTSHIITHHTKRNTLNLKIYINKEFKSALIGHAKNTISNIYKWLSTTSFHPHDLIYIGMPHELSMRETCFHLLSCCTNTHLTNLRTNWHNKVVHALAKALLTHPTIRCFTLINVGNIKDRPIKNIIFHGSSHACAIYPNANAPTV